MQLFFDVVSYLRHEQLPLRIRKETASVAFGEEAKSVDMWTIVIDPCYCQSQHE